MYIDQLKKASLPAAFTGGFLVILMVIAISCFPLYVQAMETLSSPQKWLERMALSARTLSYVGTATYEQSGMMRSVRIFHAVRDGKEFERLEYLDGPRNEVIRRRSPADCQGISSLLIKGEAVVGSNENYARLEDYYQYSIQGESRVAGHKVVQVFLKPNDRYRYGHLLSLEKTTGLLLQSMLVNSKGNILERFQFTSIDIGELIDESLLEPEMDSHLVASALPDCPPPIDRIQYADEKSSSDTADMVSPSWAANWVPPGFVLANLYTDPATQAQEMVFTDGMSSFSIFIDPTIPQQHNNVEARRGATVAYLAKLADQGKSYTVCVIGELPMKTARLVAEAVART